MKVFLAGEGRNELGSRAGHPNHQHDGEPGAIVALLTKVRAEGWTVAGATDWKSIRKFRVGHHPSHEEQNVAGAALQADEAGCDVLAFTRDRDGDPTRERDLLAGLSRAQTVYPGLSVVGGVAVEKLESWILALAGEHGSESHTHPDKRLANRPAGQKGTADMLDIIAAAEHNRIPRDAISLRDWLHQAATALR